MGEQSPKPPSHADLLNSRPRGGWDIDQSLLDPRELREMASRAKQGGWKGAKAKVNIASKAYQATKMFGSKNSRISNSTAMLMIGTAFLLDILEMATSWAIIGVIISVFIGVFGTLTFFTWFTLKGVPMSFANPKTMFTFLITSGAETLGIGLDVIPLLGWIWTIGIALLIIITRFEDKTGIKLPTSPKKGRPGTIT